jgi:hypothetical protein
MQLQGSVSSGALRERAKMKRRVVAVILAAMINAVARALEGTAGDELRFQDVIPISGATRDQIYSVALEWFSDAFKGPKASLEQNRLGGILTGRGAERYRPPFMSTACSGWIRYRVMLVAKDGRYDYTVDGFTHEGDPFCNKRSFGPLTRDWLGVRIARTIFDMTLQPPRRESAEMDAWVDMKSKAAGIAQTVSTSLRRKLSTAVVAKKPAA